MTCMEDCSLLGQEIVALRGTLTESLFVVTLKAVGAEGHTIYMLDLRFGGNHSVFWQFLPPWM